MQMERVSQEQNVVVQCMGLLWPWNQLKASYIKLEALEKLHILYKALKPLYSIKAFSSISILPFWLTSYFLSV